MDYYSKECYCKDCYCKQYCKEKKSYGKCNECEQPKTEIIGEMSITKIDSLMKYPEWRIAFEILEKMNFR